MHELDTVSGHLVEVRRFVTSAARLRDYSATRERWELWLTKPDGDEVKYVVSSRVMPARKGHAVTLILLNEEPVGMYNLHANYRVNFARADPALLMRPTDIALVIFGSFASMLSTAFLSPSILLLAVSMLVLYIPIMAAIRLKTRHVLQRSVDEMLDQMTLEKVIRPFRRRT